MRKLPVRVLVGVLLVVEIYPLVWLLLSSFKSQNEFLTEPSWALPSQLNLDNYVTAWTDGNLGTYVRNSILATFPSLVMIILLGVAAGFALEVLVWKGRNQTLLLFLVGIMVPGQMILLPLFTVYFQVGLAGTLWPLIITYTATGLPLTVFMMATFFRSVPREVFEAATLDGASVLRAFWSIGFPMVRNAVFTVALVQFFFIWNDLLIALTFTTDQNLRTIQVGLLTFSGEFGQTAYGPLFAAICINVFGALAIYLVLNQRIMKGLTAGSVKG
ncbi:raffinose/stachyose/melibiose transport system permease protein [Microbacterium endophyticum]|uniref:Raffinose/stachyose/melibiose transport system permease protein n=1 Tax=Microbacterium endophyticum TaxID=1526412 RepID=A0A7W4V1E0_9MICO|nr:carbohydrate ABC transporter permease [Microbacterium endophyticum]MBB2975076.1 raffinose/stachyose/melibiose transport system permease protein [Microbacterium endophyticum]NIK37384.1 raffinose/stachyose/melibiose transport system permease protein [Microbacterium endophyticum]